MLLIRLVTNTTSKINRSKSQSRPQHCGGFSQLLRWIYRVYDAQICVHLPLTFLSGPSVATRKSYDIPKSMHTCYIRQTSYDHLTEAASMTVCFSRHRLTGYLRDITTLYHTSMGYYIYGDIQPCYSKIKGLMSCKSFQRGI